MTALAGAWLPSLYDQLQLLVSSSSSLNAPTIQHPPVTAAPERPAGHIHCSLHARCPNDVLPKLFERLIALCGRIDFDYKMDLWHHDICYRPEAITPFGGPRNEDTALRLRADVLNPDGDFVKLHSRKWRLCCDGAPEPPKPGDRNRVTQRVMYESVIEGDALRYVEMLGYTFSFELVRKGYRFAYNNLLIEIFQPFKLETRHKVTTATLLDSEDNAWIVQVGAGGAATETAPLLAAELHAFAELVEGLISLQVVPHTVLRNRIYYPEDR
ncbi:hypothetical protein HDU90_002509 [Geranomyces variabilis]|nr:hypothetical protein HDU90_002509 [Geranomyces variabilis]